MLQSSEPRTEEAAVPAETSPQSEGPVAETRSRRRVPEAVLWSVALILLGISGFVLFGQRTNPPIPVRIGDGLHLEGLTESRSDNGWVVEGTIRNGPANVAVAQFGLSYADAAGQVVALTTVEVRDFKAGQSRDFKMAIPGYSPGLTRSIVPIRYKQKADE